LVIFCYLVSFFFLFLSTLLLGVGLWVESRILSSGFCWWLSFFLLFFGFLPLFSSLFVWWVPLLLVVPLLVVLILLFGVVFFFRVCRNVGDSGNFSARVTGSRVPGLQGGSRSKYVEGRWMSLFSHWNLACFEDLPVQYLPPENVVVFEFLSQELRCIPARAVHHRHSPGLCHRRPFVWEF